MIARKQGQLPEKARSEKLFHVTKTTNKKERKRGLHKYANKSIITNRNGNSTGRRIAVNDFVFQASSAPATKVK